MTTPHRWRARVRRVWPVAKYVIGLVLAALAFEQLVGHKAELTEATVALEGLRWGWVLLAAAAEALSLLAFAQVQRRLLRAGGASVTLAPMTAITLAANSITNSLPAGSVIAPLYAFRQYRRLGADEAVSGWAVVATFVAASVTLGVVAASGASVAGAEGAGLDLIGVIVGVLLVSLAMGVVFVQKQALAWAVTAVLRLGRRLTGWPRGELAAHIERIIRRLTAVRLSPGQLVSITALALANWLLDCACLALSFLAVGASVPWKGLLLAYGAGQLAANLPITPGGLGVVEGSLTIALVAFGGAAPTTVVAVLLYRILNFWLPLPVGWAAWAWLAWTGGRRSRPTTAPPDSADATGTPHTGTDGGLSAADQPGGDGDISQAVGG
jgi:putative heme transporter